MTRSRNNNPKRKLTRAASYKRGQERKEALRKAQEASQKRNRELRAKGEKTPHELYKAAQRAKWEARKASGDWKPATKNERGFIIETDPSGHTTLRDPGDWHKRRNDRFRAVANAQIFTREAPDSKGKGR